MHGRKQQLELMMWIVIKVMHWNVIYSSKIYIDYFLKSATIRFLYQARYSSDEANDKIHRERPAHGLIHDILHIALKVLTYIWKTSYP